MKIRPVGAELFHMDVERERERETDRQTDRHDEADCRFSKFYDST
jgi:hypothetical protein